MPEPTAPKILGRTFTAVTRAEGDTPALADWAISSELPVTRMDWRTMDTYEEVLSHQEGEIDLSYARDGLPILLSHNDNARNQVGLLENVRLDADGMLRGTPRFSRSPEAQLILQDVLDGIRTKLSVGYDDGPNYRETRENDVVTRVFAGWRPMEVSIVPIPADPTVGVGRSRAPAPSVSQDSPAVADRAKEQHMSDVSTAAPTTVGTAGVTDTAREIVDLCRLVGREKDAGEFIVSNKSVAEVREQLLRDQAAGTAAALSKQKEPLVDMTPKERKAWSIRKAVNLLAEGRFHQEGSLEKEISDEISKRLGRETSNLFMPQDYPLVDMGRFGRKVKELQGRTQLSIVAGAGKGPELRFTEYGGAIELLRQASIVMGLGAEMLDGLVGDVGFPRQTASGGATWVAEAPGSDMTLTSLTLDQPTLSPKGLQSSTTVSRRLLAQSTPAVDGLINADILAAHGVAIDAAALAGTGTNQPTGVLNAAGVNLIAYGTNGLVPTYALILAHEEEVAIDNAEAGASLAWVTTPGIRQRLRQVVKFASTASPIWEDGNTIVGRPAFVSNNVPSNLTKGTSSGVAHGVIYGDFSKITIGQWGAAEIIVDPYTLARRNLVQITSIQYVDVLVKQPTAFAVSRDALRA
jgi:hypothetical protein